MRGSRSGLSWSIGGVAPVADGSGIRLRAMPSPAVIDPKALAILTATFWTARGWRDAPSTPPDDLAYARAKGLMFDPGAIVIGHDAVVVRARAACGAVTRAQVSAAFVASLGSRRLDWRSALGSWMFGQWLASHPIVPWRKGGSCATCGAPASSSENLDILSFERHRWGGVRHEAPMYIALDLERFALDPAPSPTEADIGVLRAILAAARSLPPTARRPQLIKALAPLVRSNAAERDILVALLGYGGVLHDPAHPGFVASGMTSQQRERARAPGDGDATYPIDHWCGAHGVDEANARRLFADWL